MQLYKKHETRVIRGSDVALTGALESASHKGLDPWTPRLDKVLSPRATALLHSLGASWCFLIQGLKGLVHGEGWRSSTGLSWLPRS